MRFILSLPVQGITRAKELATEHPAAVVDFVPFVAEVPSSV